MPESLSSLLVRGLLTGCIAGGLALGATSAFADPPEGGNASCMGYEAAAVAPPGSEHGPYSQLGMPGVLDFIDQVVIPLTGAPNRGAVISSGPAALKGVGSHEACDEALGIPPGAE
jgi:hypothetical protein